MVSGQGAVLLANSIYYKVQAFFQLLLMVLVVVTNILFIPLWGIEGAAIATLFSNAVVLLLRALFIYFKWQIQPLDLSIVGLALTTAVAIYIAKILPYPVSDYWIVDMIFRSTLFLLIMGIGNHKILLEWWKTYRK
jgi:Na+-driven multidrug efflux pump